LFHFLFYSAISIFPAKKVFEPSEFTCLSCVKMFANRKKKGPRHRAPFVPRFVFEITCSYHNRFRA